MQYINLNDTNICNWWQFKKVNNKLVYNFTGNQDVWKSIYISTPSWLTQTHNLHSKINYLSKISVRSSLIVTHLGLEQTHCHTWKVEQTPEAERATWFRPHCNKQPQSTWQLRLQLPYCPWPEVFMGDFYLIHSLISVIGGQISERPNGKTYVFEYKPLFFHSTRCIYTSWVWNIDADGIH